MATIPKKSSDEIKGKYLEKDNTFSREVKDNPKDRIEIEVGDSKQSDFKPQFKFMRWDNEVNFSLRAEEHPDAVVEVEGEVIKYITPKYEVHQYDKPDASEEGGFEFEWVLPSKPSTNVLTATIETKGLDFFYQPPLTQQEIDEGASRSENVEGSYAVYHKTKGGMNRVDGMEYKVGKAFHIYRPKCIDADGAETWGELHIDEQSGLLTVTIDQTWLDNSVYPVVVDPTFGYSTIGGTNQANTSGNNVIVCLFTLSEAGSVTKLTKYDGSNSGTQNFKAVIYDVSSGNPNVRKGVGSATALDTTDQWNDLVFSSSVSLSAADYCIGWVQETNGQYRWDAGSANQQSQTGTVAGYYTSPPDPFGTPTQVARKDSIYATYTAAGGETPAKNIILSTNKFW